MDVATMTDVSSPETAERVLDYLREHPEPLGLRAIGTALSIGQNTVHRAIRRLQQDGRLAVKRLGTGDRYPTRYEVVDHDAV